MLERILFSITKGTVRSVLRAVAKIFTILLYIATLLSAYGGYFNPEWWTMPAIGVLFFPYFAIATLVLAAYWLLRRRIIIGCVGIGVLLACGPTFTEAMPFRLGNSPSDESQTFRMVTFNCLHMNDYKEKNTPATNRSLDFLVHSEADFICLQELSYLGQPEIPAKYEPQIEELKALYPYRSEDRRELKFLSKYPFQQVEVKLGDDIRYGNCAAYRLEIDGHKLTVINVHLPSFLLSDSERRIITDARSQEGVKKSIREFEGPVYQKMKTAFADRSRVAEAIAEFAEKEEGNVIVCGDFNDVPGSWSYRNFTKRGFEDAYAQTGFGHIITYNEHLMWFHIDQILFKGELVPLSVRKDRNVGSDHYPLVAEFEFI